MGNQHKIAALDTSWFKDTFAEAVRCIGHTLLVLQPWHAPVPLTRSWCLWEIHSTVEGGAELHIVLSPAQREAFQDAMVRELSLLICITVVYLTRITEYHVRTSGFMTFKQL